MRIVGFLLACSTLALAAPKAPVREPITVDLAGDKVKYSSDRKRATLEGNVRITITAPGLTGQQVVVRANRVDADLENNVIISDQGGKFVIGPALFRGDWIRLDASRQEFTIRQAEGFMAVPLLDPSASGRETKAYFKGQTVGKTGALVYVLRGRITTCDHDNPHYAIIAKRIKYDVSSGEAHIYDGRLKLYGITLPAIPWGKTRFGGSGLPRKFDPITVPGYSNREGLYLPYDWAFTGPGNPWSAATSFRVTAKRGVTGAIWARRSVDEWDVDLSAARKEWKADDISDRLSISRLPELNVTRHFGARKDPRRELKLDTSFGYYSETWETQPKGEPLRPKAEEGRAAVALSYTAQPLQYAKRSGMWYGAKGRLNLYTNEDTYRDLELFAGIGAPVGEDAKAYGTVIHHATGGNTPFLFDDVDIQTELALGGEWELVPKLTVDGWGRYDLDKTDLRDYEMGLSFRAHCLTWRLFYRDVGNRIGFRVDLTGLTGNTRPYLSESRMEREMAAEGLSIRGPVGKGKGLRLEGEGAEGEGK